MNGRHADPSNFAANIEVGQQQIQAIYNQAQAMLDQADTLPDPFDLPLDPADEDDGYGAHTWRMGTNEQRGTVGMMYGQFFDHKVTTITIGYPIEQLPEKTTIDRSDELVIFTLGGIVTGAQFKEDTLIVKDDRKLQPAEFEAYERAVRLVVYGASMARNAEDPLEREKILSEAGWDESKDADTIREVFSMLATRGKAIMEDGEAQMEDTGEQFEEAIIKLDRIRQEAYKLLGEHAFNEEKYLATLALLESIDVAADFLG